MPLNNFLMFWTSCCEGHRWKSQGPDSPQVPTETPMVRKVKGLRLEVSKTTTKQRPQKAPKLGSTEDKLRLGLWDFWLPFKCLLNYARDCYEDVLPLAGKRGRSEMHECGQTNAFVHSLAESCHEDLLSSKKVSAEFVLACSSRCFANVVI